MKSCTESTAVDTFFASERFFSIFQYGLPLKSAVLVGDFFTIISNSPTEVCSRSLHFIFPDYDLISNQICPYCMLLNWYHKIYLKSLKYYL